MGSLIAAACHKIHNSVQQKLQIEHELYLPWCQNSIRMGKKGIILKKHWAQCSSNKPFCSEKDHGKYLLNYQSKSNFNSYPIYSCPLSSGAVPLYAWLAESSSSSFLHMFWPEYSRFLFYQESSWHSLPCPWCFLINFYLFSSALTPSPVKFQLDTYYPGIQGTFGKGLSCLA